MFSMTIYVNVGGTSNQNCSCKVKFTPSNANNKSGWIAHYIIETNDKITKCSMKRKKKGEEVWSHCNRNAKLGAHIRKKNPSSNDNQYIVPACNSCNGFLPTNIDFKLKRGVKKIRALSSKCQGTQTVSFAANSAKSTTRNSREKRTCKWWGCSTCPQGRYYYCWKHRTMNKKKAKLGTKSNPYITKAKAERGRKKGIVWYYYRGIHKNLRSMNKK